jgi:hypothetical protein
MHKMGMELLVPDARPLNPEMPFGHRDFGGKWRFAMHDLGADANTGLAITNKWENKGQFIAWFKYYVRPLHYEFMVSWFHKSEQMCIPNINTCHADPGYPAQYYNSALPTCPLPAGWIPAGTTTPPALPPGSVPAGTIPQDNYSLETPNQ